MLELLTQDTLLDQTFTRTAALFDTDSYFTPIDEADHDLVIRRHMLGDGCTECNFINDVVRDYLKFPDPAQAAAIRKRKAAEKLGGYAREGRLFGIGAEKAAALHQHPTPCAEMWKRMRAADS